MVRYASMVDSFRAREASRLGIKPKDVRVKGNSESALLFKAARDSIKTFGQANKAWHKQLKKENRKGTEAEYKKFLFDFYRKKYPRLTDKTIDTFIHASFKTVGYKEPEWNRYVS